MAIYSLGEEWFWCSCDLDLTVKGVSRIYLAITYINEVWKCLLSLMGYCLIIQLSNSMKVGLYLWEFSINKYQEHRHEIVRQWNYGNWKESMSCHGHPWCVQDATDSGICQMHPMDEACMWGAASGFVPSHHLQFHWTGKYKCRLLRCDFSLSPTNCPLFLEHLKRERWRSEDIPLIIQPQEPDLCPFSGWKHHHLLNFETLVTALKEPPLYTKVGLLLPLHCNIITVIYCIIRLLSGDWS